jgi:hypothetical protein
MDYNEILLTKLEQCIDAFNAFNGDRVTLTIQAIQDNTKQVKSLQGALNDVKIPKEITSMIKHQYEHKHINGGVRFMLITMISVILIAAGISGYCHHKYYELKDFEKNYNLYVQNNDWQIAFFGYMSDKHPKELKKYINEHPLPK